MKFRAWLGVSVIGLGMIAESVAADAPLAVSESVSIAASPDAVWQAIRNFGDMAWHPAVRTTELQPGKTGKELVVRRLTLKDDGLIVEQLLENDEGHRIQRYTILESPLPVTEYEAALVVSAGENGTSVIGWHARFLRKPDAAVSDEALAGMIGGIFAAGLDGLKKRLEAPR